MSALKSNASPRNAVRVVTYATPSTRTLDLPCQARQLMTALHCGADGWIELDFPDVAGISQAFSDEFCRLAEQDFPDRRPLQPRHSQVAMRPSP